MLLSNRYQFLFVHIAKTGGSSIRAALSSTYWRDPWQLPTFLCHRLSQLTGHRIGAKFPRHAPVVAAQEMLSPRYFDSLFKFAFVRNPWDRLVSAHHHLLREHPDIMRRNHIDAFPNFARWIHEHASTYRGPKHVFIASVCRPQLDYLIDLTGDQIVDFVGRYENLPTDYSQACAQMEIRSAPLPHKRKSERHDFRQYYDDVTAELIGKCYQCDVVKFGYSFDLPATKQQANLLVA